MTKRTYSVIAPTPGHATWTHHGTHCVCECGHKTGTRPQMTRHFKLAATMHERAERKAAAWAGLMNDFVRVFGREDALAHAERHLIAAAAGRGSMNDENLTALAKWAVAA